MNFGKLQRRWSTQKPPVYDKETRIVCLDIKAEQQKDMDGNTQDGYSYIPVEIDRQIDYGHIKSQLIEKGFAQKDEFGLVMNAMGDLLKAAKASSSWDDFIKAAKTEDILAFEDFVEFRQVCADAAKEVLKSY